MADAAKDPNEDILAQLLGLGGLDAQGDMLKEQLAAALALGKKNPQQHYSAIGGALGGLNDSLGEIASVMQQNKVRKAQRERQGEVDRRLAGVAHSPVLRHLLRLEEEKPPPPEPIAQEVGSAPVAMGAAMPAPAAPMGPPGAPGAQSAARVAALRARPPTPVIDPNTGTIAGTNAAGPMGLLASTRQSMGPSSAGAEPTPQEAIGGALSAHPGAIDPVALSGLVSQAGRQAVGQQPADLLAQIRAALPKSNQLDPSELADR